MSEVTIDRRFRLKCTPTDLLGRKIGKLEVFGYLGKTGRSHKYIVKCDCGNIKVVHKSGLRNNSQLIGCDECVAKHLSIATRKYPLHRAKFAYQLIKYKITLDNWDSLITEQVGKCKICIRPFSPELIPMIDHNHTTKEVRGILCGPCNFILDYAEKHPEWKRNLTLSGRGEL